MRIIHGSSQWSSQVFNWGLPSGNQKWQWEFPLLSQESAKMDTHGLIPLENDETFWKPPNADTLLQVLLHILHTFHVMLHCCKFSSTSLHMSCYVLDLQAALLQVLLPPSWRTKSEYKKWPPLWFWQKTNKYGLQKNLVKQINRLTPFHETVKKTMVYESLCGTEERKKKRSETRPLQMWVRKQPSGMCIQYLPQLSDTRKHGRLIACRCFIVSFPSHAIGSSYVHGLSINVNNVMIRKITGKK